MWEKLRQILVDFLRRSQMRAQEQRADKKRARFWAELRAGEQEAEARSKS